jgi:hypothetical protein
VVGPFFIFVEMSEEEDWLSCDDEEEDEVEFPLASP